MRAEIRGTLERAFGVTLSADEAARCTDPDAAAETFAAQVGARDVEEDSLRALAHGEVAMALAEAGGSYQCAADDAIPLEVVLPPRRRGAAWKSLQAALRITLSPLGFEPAAVVVSAVVVAVVAWLAVQPWWDDFMLSPLVVVPWLLVSANRPFPPEAWRVGDLVDAVLRQRPASLVEGGRWTRSNVVDVVDAAFRSPPQRGTRL